jgi:hypothetical protein
MVTVGTGMSTATSAGAATREALAQAVGACGAEQPKLAIVFAAAEYGDLEDVGSVAAALLGEVPVVGGTSAALAFCDGKVARRGVSATVLGGAGIQVAQRSVRVQTPHLAEVVPAAESLAEAAVQAERAGYLHHTCLAFAPSMAADGEAIVAAVRKGAGARAQLAGALTGAELAFGPAKVLRGTELRADHVVLTGLFTRRPIGVAARHGWRSVGPTRTVTRTDGVYLLELDGRPAAEVWADDAQRAGGAPPTARKELLLYLASEYQLGMVAPPQGAEPSDEPLVVRAPLGIKKDGSVALAGAIAEGTHVRIVHAQRDALLRAAGDAASAAILGAGPPIAGALVLACSSRVTTLGDAFAEEPAEIYRRVRAPVGGACVFGEIARNIRDVDAFFNATTVVMAFGA